jgi:nucleotidyltransferase substrate binding protein (TIGR01987 family)
MDDARQRLRDSAATSLDELQKVLSWLDADPKAPDRWGRLDAVAKRFEVSFEYYWKFLKAAAEWQGTEAPGPRPAIAASHQYGWIEDPESWAGYLEARNAGVHDYFGLSSEDYAAKARAYLEAARKVLSRVPR